MRNRLNRLELPFGPLWIEGKLCLLIVILVGCSSSQTPTSEAQKAADRYAAMQFVKCGDVSYESNFGEIHAFRNLKVIARHQDPERAADYKESRQRQGIDWYDSIEFECTASNIYSMGRSTGWTNGRCMESSIKLVHQKGVWRYEMGSTLEQLTEAKKSQKPLTCENVPH